MTLSVLERVHHHRAISCVVGQNDNGFVFLTATFERERKVFGFCMCIMPKLSRNVGTSEVMVRNAGACIIASAI